MHSGRTQDCEMGTREQEPLPDGNLRVGHPVETQALHDQNPVTMLCLVGKGVEMVGIFMAGSSTTAQLSQLP